MKRSKPSKPKASQVKGGPIVVIHNTSQEDIAQAMKEAKQKLTLSGDESNMIKHQGPKYTQRSLSPKLTISGDDVLIEYTTRLYLAIKAMQGHNQLIMPEWSTQVEEFIGHNIWKSAGPSRDLSLWEQLRDRVNELKERRKKNAINQVIRENPHLYISGSHNHYTLTSNSIDGGSSVDSA